jgi:hypothetical protein
MINATSFWYNATACPGTSGTAGGCNGNGNAAIDASGSSTSNEEVRAWQHLSYASLIDGSYTGTGTSNNGYDVVHIPGVNCPASKYSPGGYWFRNQAFSSTVGAINFIGLGSQGPDVAWSSLFSPMDAYNIDMKMDDGVPNTGRVIGGNGYNASASCLNGNLYNLTITTVVCILYFNIIN